MEEPFSISLRCPSGALPPPFCDLSRHSPSLSQFHLSVQPNCARRSRPQFQEQKHFHTNPVPSKFKGRTGLHFSFEEERAHLFWTHPLAWLQSSSDRPHGPDSTTACFHRRGASNTERESTFGLEECRPCLGHRAALEACSWKQTAPTTPAQPATDVWEPGPNVHPCCSRGRHSAFLRLNREEGTWTGMYGQPSLPGACLSGFLRASVPMDCIMRRDLFVEGSFQLYCLTQR